MRRTDSDEGDEPDPATRPDDRAGPDDGARPDGSTRPDNRAGSDDGTPPGRDPDHGTPPGTEADDGRVPGTAKPGDGGEPDDVRPGALIELGDGAAGADPFAGGEQRPRRRVGGGARAVPRRHLALGGAGLLAVGFVAGLLVQRANTPDSQPTPAASAKHLSMPVSAFGPTGAPERMGGCHFILRGRHEAGVDRVCTGTVRTVAHRRDDWRLIITHGNFAPLAVTAHADTKLLPTGTVGHHPTQLDLEVGRKVRISGWGGTDGTLHAVAIQRG